MPAPVSQLLYCTPVLFKVLLLFTVTFMYYFCEKYYKPITVQYFIDHCVSWVPRLTWLDLKKKQQSIHMQETYCISPYQLTLLFKNGKLLTAFHIRVQHAYNQPPVITTTTLQYK